MANYSIAFYILFCILKAVIKMKTQEINSRIPTNQSLTSQDLFVIIRSVFPHYTEAACRWIIYALIKEGHLTRIGKGIYRKGQTNDFVCSFRSSEAQAVERFCQKESFPGNVIVWETIMLNEWLNHQIGRNIVFVETEKGMSEFVFDRLKGRIRTHILWEPNKQELDKYGGDNPIVIQDAFSRSPRQLNSIHIRLEKLLVDVCCDNILKEVISPSEIDAIYEGVLKNYSVNMSTLLTYAKRRGCLTTVREYASRNSR